MEGNDDLQAVVKRYAFLVMRISMIQTRIRQFEANDLSPEIYCIDADFERSLQIVLCCYEHSRLLHSSMPVPSVRPLKIRTLFAISSMSCQIASLQTKRSGSAQNTISISVR